MVATTEPHPFSNHKNNNMKILFFKNPQQKFILFANSLTITNDGSIIADVVQDTKIPDFEFMPICKHGNTNIILIEKSTFDNAQIHP